MLHLVGKLNFFEFQEGCLPIIELNLDQVHAYPINFQSYFSRKQSFVRKNFIPYFLFGITTFPLVSPVTWHPIYIYTYSRNNVKLLRETHVTRLVGNNAGKSDDVVPVSGRAARVHACACRGSEVAEALLFPSPSNVVTLVSFALIPALYGRR